MGRIEHSRPLDKLQKLLRLFGQELLFSFDHIQAQPIDMQAQLLQCLGVDDLPSGHIDHYSLFFEEFGF